MLTRYFLSIFLLFPLLGLGQIKCSRVLKMMGTRFEITAIHEDSLTALAAVDLGIAEIQRIEKLISSWDPNSETSAINDAAGVEAVVVSDELFQLILRAKKISTLTDGAFDISFASMDRIWVFDGHEIGEIDTLKVQEAKRNVGYQKISLDEKEHSVFLTEKGMKIAFGAIGKGYAADKAAKKMQAFGIENGVLDASGDLFIWGHDLENPWHVGIADPAKSDKWLGWLEVKSGAIVTSGNYEKYLLIGGKRYAHIVDPRTGFPVRGIASVTVICPNAELADALATSVFVLGEVQGLMLLNKLNNVEGLVVTEDGRILETENLKLMIK